MKNNVVVLDTNCIISALLISNSVSYQALKKADHSYTLAFSAQTLEELNEIVVRSKFDKYISLDDRLYFINALEKRGKIIEVSSDFMVCRDIKDNKFLNLAFDSEATYLITGDKDLLELNPFYHTKILSPASFILK